MGGFLALMTIHEERLPRLPYVDDQKRPIPVHISFALYNTLTVCNKVLTRGVCDRARRKRARAWNSTMPSIM